MIPPWKPQTLDQFDVSRIPEFPEEHSFDKINVDSQKVFAGF